MSELPDRIRDSLDLEVFLWGGPERTCRPVAEHLAAIALLARNRPELPPKDCDACMFRKEEWRDGGHCYMFREEPSGDLCGQFRAK